jgi:hypothetical protein
MDLSITMYIKIIIPVAVSLIFLIFHWVYYKRLPLLSVEEETELTEDELLSKYPQGRAARPLLP